LGSALSWTSPVLPVISENADGLCGTEDEDYEDCYWDTVSDAMSSDEASWVGGICPIGALISSFVTVWSMAVAGPKWTMMAMAVPMEVGWLILTLAGPLEWTDAWIFYIGRFLTGKVTYFCHLMLM